PKGRRAGSDYVTFSISYGTRRGATKARILSQICRRGGVSGDVIGAIQLQSGRSLFQIARKAASQFEEKVRQPDKRDPGIRIEQVPIEIDVRSQNSTKGKSAQSTQKRTNTAPPQRRKRRKPNSPA
ncbi:MAG: DbpA RNA binding domain-containing protein, partial [Myxococcota bacterium]|nr:DbpA RNA binding domain-containing protein [Myxococcota bacterium]